MAAVALTLSSKTSLPVRLQVFSGVLTSPHSVSCADHGTKSWGAHHSHLPSFNSPQSLPGPSHPPSHLISHQCFQVACLFNLPGIRISLTFNFLVIQIYHLLPFITSKVDSLERKIKLATYSLNLHPSPILTLVVDAFVDSMPAWLLWTRL